MTEHTPTITVLAGVNGAGKSSIIGNFIRLQGGTYFNPDEAARRLQKTHSWMDLREANSLAWTLGREGLEAAIASRRDFVFETTLGGNTIPALLGVAARRGMRVVTWYVGLGSVDKHVRRVRSRVSRGGHDIPEALIRKRYGRSLENLVTLAPELYELRLFDNSETVDLEAGEAPQPRVLLHVKDGEVVELADLRSMPEWAKPVVAASIGAQGTGRRGRRACRRR